MDPTDHEGKGYMAARKGSTARHSEPPSGAFWWVGGWHSLAVGSTSYQDYPTYLY